MQEEDLQGAGGVWQLEGDRADQRLRQRRREQRTSQSSRLEARADRTDESDGEHPDIQQVGRVVVLDPDEAGGSVEPDDQECSRERSADSESVRGVAQQVHHSSKLVLSRRSYRRSMGVLGPAASTPMTLSSRWRSMSFL